MFRPCEGHGRVHGRMKTSIVPRVVEPMRIGKAPVDKLRKYRAEDFRAKVEGDVERVEFWLENTTVSSVVPNENITWEFFQAEFRKKYIIQRFLDSKRKEFLELKQGNKTVSEYKREFVRLSQYATEWVQLEIEMSNQAKKTKELNNERKQAKRKARVSNPRDIQVVQVAVELLLRMLLQNQRLEPQQELMQYALERKPLLPMSSRTPRNKFWRSTLENKRFRNNRDTNQKRLLGDLAWTDNLPIRCKVRWSAYLR
ncbi:2-succinyl-5-enolpyruvyl-6-hydroxy-3-cyclohexene-1-carboxylate synthase [Gossypium arboreum]|uniref:2-succinyl-5-enolpyruvyl-6-hydroxy-3-cyclohexene-1-carboxylate synthase n=1 Tax=Gossypium arboreum TaxID=29729 RepID=A0A0B0PPH0_GOSAR|nr:2-succinyl-5-enolpyruvyl-6-hydroxy-3-cyclohexene-1-carboxylate synthase [Gossypium arboreum]